RRQHDGADALTGEALDDVLLFGAHVLLRRPFPDDLDVAVLLRRLQRPRVDRLPEGVRGPLGDDHDAVARRPLAWRTAAQDHTRAQPADQQQTREVAHSW